VSALFGQSTGAAGGYALVAMGGVVAAATHAPITAILIIFEITYDYAIILPLMTVCIISTVLARALSRESIYTLKLVRRGIDLLGGRSLDVLKAFAVSDCLKEDMETFSPDTPAADLVRHMMVSEQNQFYITTGEGRLFGVVSVGDLHRLLLHREGLERVLLAEDVAHEQAPACYPGDPLSGALLKFEDSGLAELPVVDAAASRKLLGVLRYRDVFAVYNDQIMKLESAEGLAHRVSSGAPQRVRLAEGFSIIEWEPPATLWGKTLAECALPTRYRVRVVLIKRRSEEGGEKEVVPRIPGPDYMITDQDTLLVCGRDEDLDGVQQL
jgi:CIC family chloride channel protein